MPMTDLTPQKGPTERPPHTISLLERRELRVTGITDVISYDAHTVTASTTRGNLTVEGEGLHVGKISLEEGILLLSGNIAALYYADEAPSAQGGFFARLFR